MSRTVYACGYCIGAGPVFSSYGMFAGPYPALEEALAAAPDDGEEAQAVLLCFAGGRPRAEVLYRWSRPRGRWVRVRW